MGFLEGGGRSWACFLVTFRTSDRRWKGYFSFRPEDGEWEEDVVRTADIFLEGSEGEIHRKARELGRPLLQGLLASALHTRPSRRDEEESPPLRRWFRDLLSEQALQHGDPGAMDRDVGDHGGPQEPGRTQLESLYASYRVDQVAHLIALLRPEDFEAVVERILEGQSVDFSSRDRLQMAMLVVERLERLLPLPPFHLWAEDFLANREAYHLYAHTLHRTGRLP